MKKFTYSLPYLAVALSCSSIAAEIETNQVNKAANEEFEVIVVSGSRVDKPLADVAGSISVVSKDTIDKHGLTDVNQLFKYDPSVQVTGGVGEAQNINIRGMGGDRVLLIKDGMRMNEGYGANGQNDIVGRGFIDLDTLKQVEVAKGAASSLYGADALGGIVVFTTKDASDYLEPGEKFAAKLKAGHSSFNNQNNVTATAALETGIIGQVFNIVKRDGEEQSNFQKSQSPFAIESTSFLYKADIKLNDDNTIKVSYDTWKQDRNGDAADGLLFYFRGLANYGYNIAEENSLSEKETTATKIEFATESATPVYDSLKVSVYNNESSQSDEEYGLLDINAPMFGVVEKRDMWRTGLYQQTTTGLLSSASKKLNQFNTINFGIDYEETESLRSQHEYREVAGNSTKDEVTNKFPTNNTERLGVYLHDEVTLLNGDVLLSPGVRFDSYKMDPNGAKKTNGETFATIEESNVSFKVGGLYKVSEYLNVFAQYGQGFKVPAYDLAYAEHYNQAASTYIYEIVPSDDLKPETSDTMEIGIRGHIQHFVVSAAVFSNKFDNFLTTKLVDSKTVMKDDGSFSHVYDTFQYQNIESASIHGAEVSVTYHVNNEISVMANAGYQEGKNDQTGQYLKTISPLSGVLAASYEADNWQTEVLLSWADKMENINDDEAAPAGYGIVDWKVTYNVNEELGFNLAVDNVFDREYVTFAKAAGRGHDADLTGLTETGRAFSASVNYRF